MKRTFRNAALFGLPQLVLDLTRVLTQVHALTVASKQWRYIHTKAHMRGKARTKKCIGRNGSASWNDTCARTLFKTSSFWKRSNSTVNHETNARELAWI
jgi:hypothetical protein